MEFYEVLKAECDRQHIPVSKAVLEAGEKLGSLSGWKKGASPNSKAVIALADYLHVSVDYLLGRSAPAELPNDAAELLSVFSRLNPQLCYIYKTDFYDRWNAKRQALGLRDTLVPYSCRHTYITELTALNVSPAMLQELAGHEDYETTLNYTHLSVDDRLKEVNRLK